MANMTALAIVQEASVRLGIVAPTTLFPGTADASKFDTDAQLLLGALKQSVRNSVAVAPFQQLLQRYDSPTVTRSTDGLGEYMFPLPVGFDGFVSDGILAVYKEPTEDDISHLYKVFLCTFNDFLYGESGIPSFLVFNNSLWIRGTFDDTKPPTLSYTCFYKTKFSYPSAEIPTADGDISLLPDELIILGVVMYYKNYRGLDYQLEMKNYSDYLTHMRTTGFDPTIAAPSLYKDVEAMNLLRQNNQQQQQQQQQQRG